jgi:hypothetical protein
MSAFDAVLAPLRARNPLVTLDEELEWLRANCPQSVYDAAWREQPHTVEAERRRRHWRYLRMMVDHVWVPAQPGYWVKKEETA